MLTLSHNGPIAWVLILYSKCVISTYCGKVVLTVTSNLQDRMIIFIIIIIYQVDLFTLILLCIIIDFFLYNQPDALIIQIYSLIKLRVSGIFSAYRQEFSTVHSSSSLGTTTSIIECFGLLNILFPIIAILDAASQILLSFFMSSYVIFPSISWSS